MDLDKFSATLDGSLRFTRLHGWVDQTEEHIRSVKNFFSTFPDAKDDYSRVIFDRLPSVNSTEEKLLLLIYLRYLDMPAEQIAELFLKHLNGKLGKRDTININRYFFAGGVPIPEEFSKEITDRVFLSYHRAIYQAMQIGGFESDFDAQNIMLFFVQLLCRNNLYDQNRAMIYLLLSRIDCPVPEIIETMVREAMTKLKDVIAVVEERQESVLTDAHPDQDTKLENYSWNTGENAPPVKKARQKPVSPTASDVLVRPWNTDMYADVSVSGGPTPARAVPPTTPPQASAEPFVTTPAFAPPTQTGQPAIPPKPAPGHQAKDGTADQPLKIERSQAVDSHLGKASAMPSVPMPAEIYDRPDAPNLLDLPYQTDSQGEPQRPSKPGDRFRISFSRQTSELNAVIQMLEASLKLGPKANDAEGLEASQAPGIAQTPEVESINRVRPRPWPWPWRLILVGLGILLAILVTIFLVRQLGSTSVGGGPDPGSPGSTPVASVVVEPPTVTGGFAIQAQGGQLVWTPAKGHRLWNVYIGLRDGSVVFPGSENIKNLEWTEFLASVKRLNPGLAELNLIHPEQKIILQ